MSIKKQVSKTAIIAARNEGATIAQLSTEFGLTPKNIKKIITDLGLPKRAKTEQTYSFVEDMSVHVSEETNS